MKVKLLRPISIPQGSLDAIEREILKLFKEQIYLPLLKEIQESRTTLRNDSLIDLIKALSNGTLQYVDGHFEGESSASISKELKRLGAKWDRVNQRWTLPRKELTPDMLSAIEASRDRFEKMADKMDRKLSGMLSDEISDQVKLEPLFDTTLYRFNKTFEASVRNITVSPTITKEQRAQIAKEYTENLKRYIKDWTEEEITKMRKKISEVVPRGTRKEDLAEIIRESYGVGRNKARFLARQETNLMLASFKKSRYQSAGINQYKWKNVLGTKAHPVRPDHKLLDNTIQDWSMPPVTNRKTGAKNNPGEDFGCRCQAIPVVKF